MVRRTYRLLAVELLERRDLLAVLRMAAWNTLNGPNDAAAEDDFATVLAAIGAESVSGNAKRLDLLALAETDPPGSGGDSIGRIEGLLDGLYPTTDYASIVSSEDGGGDSTGFVYDVQTLSLLEAVEVAPESLTHTVLRGTFRPVETLGESDFYVYTVHLKSGDSSGDRTIRGEEAALLRNDAELLGEGAQIVMMGDFNWFGSDEPAYANLTAPGAGQLYDPAAAPGNWSDNGLFRGLHTQNPRDQMDDRFDMHLASGELFDDVGLEYVEGSYRVLGNDGTHTLNGPITTGSGAAPDVLAALIEASDHLPVVADYEIIPAKPRVRIQPTGTSTRTVEGGLIDSYRVVLDTVPTAEVRVALQPDGEVDLGSVGELIFTPATALTPQTVLVAAADDDAGEGNHAGLVTHSVQSGDDDYDGIVVDPLAVELIDDDAPTIVINEIDADTQGIDALEFIELYDGGVGNVSLDGKSLVFFNGNGDLAYEVFDLTGLATDSRGLFVAGNASVAGIDLVFANNSLQNGPDAVALYDGLFPLGGPVTTAGLLDAVVYGSGDEDDPGLLALLPAGELQLDEDAQGNKDFDAVARLPDHGTPRQTASFVARPPSPDRLNDPPPASASVLQTGARVDVVEGGAGDRYLLVLDTIPAAPVAVTVDPDEQLDVGAGPGMPLVLTFTPADALLPQEVNVAAVDDFDLEGDHVGVVTHVAASADINYDGLTLPSVSTAITDNEAPPFTAVVISEVMYNPASDESEPGIAEWIEVVNAAAAPVDLGNWLFDDEDASDWGQIPSGTVLGPNQAAVFFDEQFTDAETFRAEWNVPADALTVGIAWGSLANSPSEASEILVLVDAAGSLVDLVNYDDAPPWPGDDPHGASIALAGLLLDNNDGAAWARAIPGVDFAVSPVGPVFSTSDVGAPGHAPSSADFNGDGRIGGVDFLNWQRGVGAVVAAKGDGDADNDRDVDRDDFAHWAADYGRVADWAASAVGDAEAEAESVALALAFSSSDVWALPVASLQGTGGPTQLDTLLDRRSSLNAPVNDLAAELPQPGFTPSSGVVATSLGRAALAGEEVFGPDSQRRDAARERIFAEWTDTREVAWGVSRGVWPERG